MENSKKLYAMIIGAREDEISFIPNTTSGINTGFSMLPIEDEVDLFFDKLKKIVKELNRSINILIY